MKYLYLLFLSLSTVNILEAQTTFVNSTPININGVNQMGPATPYPSDITVSGMTGTVSNITVTISGFSHSVQIDVDILLVGPAGQKIILWSDAGWVSGATNLTLTFSDAAAVFLPEGPAALYSGTFKPTNYDVVADPFPVPAPAPTDANSPAPGGVATLASIFNGTAPNGAWSLYVVDDASGDVGAILGGWSISITTLDPVCPPGNILYVNYAASGNNDGTSWFNAYTKLQDALANTCPDVTQIWVAKGTYYPDEGGGKTNDDRGASFAMKNNLAIYGGFAGTETMLSQRNWKVNQTILSGDIDQNDGVNLTNMEGNTAGVVHSANVNNTAVLDGFLIKAGNTEGMLVGGGMDNKQSSPVVTNCIFSGNRAQAGGGMFNEESSPLVTNCIFSNNMALYDAGGMYNLSGSSPTIINCSFISNSSGQSAGGGIENVNDPDGVSVINCSFSGNQGGAISNLSGPLTVKNCVLWGNDFEFVGGTAPDVSFSIVQGGITGTGNLDKDPLFVNAANGDLHLTACSPAIDAGNDAANNLTTDLDGSPRKVDAIAGGSKIDMGAFEFQSALPSATISGSTTVCLNANSPNITFTASGGTAPYSYTFNYTLNSASQTPVTTVSGNSITVAVPTNAAGQFDYSLVSVQDNSSGTCPQTITNQTATVVVNPLPTAHITGATAVCKGDPTPTITFSGSGGTAPYTFTYTSPDGVTTNNVTGNPGVKNAPTVTPGAFTYTLTNVKDASVTGCSQSISGESVIITVNPLPDATITTGSPVTAASSGNVATVPDAGTGATYAWTITNGTISGANDTRSITYKAGNSGSVILNVSVKSGSGCGPVSAALTVSITAQPCPNPAISVPWFVCSASTGNRASVADAGTGAKYVWSITNGTITGGSGTRQISFTAGTNKYADYDSDDFVKLSVKVTNASGVCTESSGTYKIFISPIPSATISTTSTVCSMSANNCASVSFAGLGAIYKWTITGGTITGGAGTRSISYTANASGSVVLTATVTNCNGCSAYSGNKSIAIVALPVANITTASPVCGSSGNNTASITAGSTGTKYCWNISNGCINSGSSTNSITYTAGSSGTVTLSVTVTNSSGCKTSSSNKLVTINAVPNATITAPSVVCSGSTGNSASVPSAGSGAAYSWSISGGTITSGNGTSSVKYTAASSGYITLGVTVTNANGCKKTGSKKILTSSNVTPTFAQIGPLCKGSKAPSLPTKSTNGITGSWNPSTISTSSLTTTTYTFTPSAGQCASTTKMQIKVQTCSGIVAKSVVTEEVIVEAMDAKLLQNPAHSQFTVIIEGTRTETAEIRVFDMLGRSLDHFRTKTGVQVNFGGSYINGIYLVEVVQGTERKVLKAVKQ